MDLKQCRYFVTVVECGNITQAAKKLHISQPPLSVAMHQLEEEMGVSLFDRGSRNISLTSAGQHFYKRAKILLDLSCSIKNEVRELQDSDKTTIRIGVISSVCDLVIHALGEFIVQYPECNFDVIEANTYQMVELLLSGNIELAVVRSPFETRQLDARPLKTEKLVFFGLDKYFEELHSDNGSNKVPFVIYRRWEKIFRNYCEVNFIKPNIRLICDDSRTAVVAAKKGIGIALIPSNIANENVTRDMNIEELDFYDFNSEIKIVKKKKTILSSLHEKLFNEIEIDK